MKKTTRSYEEVKALRKEGYKIVSVGFFIENMIPVFTLEK